MPAEEYADRLRRTVDAWIAARAQRVPPTYEYRLGAGFLEIVDTRFEPVRELS